MFVTLTLILAAASANPVCEKFCDPDPMCQAVCDTPDRKQQQAICEARLMSTANDLNELEGITNACFNALTRCEAKLKEKSVCPVKKPIKKKVKPAPKPPVVVPVKPSEPSCCGGQHQEQHQEQSVVVNVIVEQPKPVVEPVKKGPIFGIGGMAAVGLLPCDPYVFGLLGARFRLLPAHLGLEVATQFNQGHLAQLMLYPVQGPIAWHLDGGALLFLRDGAQINLLAGTGIEAQIIPHLSLTADWRVTFPKDPTLANTLLQSQLMFGLLVHTW